MLHLAEQIYPYPAPRDVRGLVEFANAHKFVVILPGKLPRDFVAV
ncbi:hypothetical protein SDC9_173331 [bioreactor metagenome]|uniref:Uncharacterized protein n=1 Tax=bioreactor metagenome TaxID=1076179 RepID=A0A645GIF7_9ZZZZ